MNTAKLDQIISNLKNTIDGKQALLTSLNEADYSSLSTGEQIARRATIEFLTLNVRELSRILVDLEDAQKDLV